MADLPGRGPLVAFPRQVRQNFKNHPGGFIFKLAWFLLTFEASFLVSKYRKVCCNVKNLVLKLFLWLIHVLFRLLHLLQVSAPDRNGSKSCLNQFRLFSFAEQHPARCWCVRCWLWAASLPAHRAVNTCSRYGGSSFLTRQILKSSKRIGWETSCLRI